MAFGELKLLGCPICGLRVDPREVSCGRCGHKFSDDTRFECPFCGEPVPQGSTSCPTCHVDFSTFASGGEKRLKDSNIDGLLMDIIKLEAAEVKAEGKRLSCPRCAWLLDGTEESCPKCKLVFSEDVSFQCPVCGELVGQQEDRCPSCGSAFVDEEEEEASEKAHDDVTSRLSEIMDIVGAEDRETAPEPAPAPPPPPQPPPVEPPAASPEERAVLEAIDDLLRAPQEEEVRPTNAPEPELKQEPAEKAEPSSSKKPRQRKLKAKTGPKKTE